MIATKNIPLMTPYVAPGTVEAVSNVLRTRWLGQGPLVEKFEARFSEQIAGGRACVATGSGTDALHLSYILAGIGPGDEVIAPLFTCTATNIPLLYCGAKIRFCDVAPNSLNMDPQSVLKLISSRTKAIVVVNYGGEPVSPFIFPIPDQCRLKIPVIEDSAQFIYSDMKIRGDYACHSFQAVKHITTGDGGMLVLPEDRKAEAKRRRWFGIDREAKLNGTWANDITELGFKYQLTDIGAAMGLCGLDALDEQITYRRAMRESYSANLSGIDGIRMIDTDPESACWLMTVLVERRDDFRKKLASEGIESDQTHYRNDRYTIFKDFRGEFPNMDAIDGKYLVIPMHMGMTVEDVQHICSVIRSGW